VDRISAPWRSTSKRAFAKIQLPTGFSIRLAGQIQQQRETFEGLLFADDPGAGPRVHGDGRSVQIADRSLRHHVFGPDGFPGVILILFLTDTTLSTTSMMGINMMLGIVVSTASC